MARVIREDLSRNFGYLVNDVARLMRTVYDRRVRTLGLTRSQSWRVHLTAAAEPAMRKLRKQAFGLRRDALAGLSARQREQFVDALLAIKSNLSRLK